MIQPVNPEEFLLGADLSLAKRIADAGGRYRHHGRGGSLPSLLRQAGMNSARLRLFHTPSGEGAQVNDLAYTLALARELHDEGFAICLAPHYSDTWADPGKQFVPAAWAHLGFAELVDEVYAYSRGVATAFRMEGIVPRVVQIGNEITPGILWEHGRIARGHSAASLRWDAEELGESERASWARLAELLKAGAAGFRDGLAPHATEIMLHIDRGGDWEASCWFFGNIESHGVPYDAAGLSYYPFWHGMPEDLDRTCRELLERFGKPIHLAELAHPHRAHPFYGAALCGSDEVWNGIVQRYPLTPEGQRRFVEEVVPIIMDLPGGGGRAALYWAPEWIPVAGFRDEADAEACWARALFDEDGNALPALDSFAQLRQRAARPGREPTPALAAAPADRR